MKKIFSILALFAVLGISAPAFANTVPSFYGFVYQNTTSPGEGFNLVAPQKSGSASCKSIFYIVGIGNCSVREAMKNGGITQLSHYDIQRENILGIQTITIKAYGR